MLGRSRWRGRMNAHSDRLEALAARMDAHIDSPPGPGDARWEAEMARLAAELDTLTAEGKPLLAEALHAERRVRVAAWLAVMGVVLFCAAQVWATWAVAHHH